MTGWHDRRPKVRVTHKPTGISFEVAVGFPCKSMMQARLMAKLVVRSMVAGPVPTTDRVRTYDMGSPAGTFIRDHRTGQTCKGDAAMHAALGRGEIDHLLLAGHKKLRGD